MITYWPMWLTWLGCVLLGIAAYAAAAMLRAPEARVRATSRPRERAYIVGTIGRVGELRVVRMVGIYSHRADALCRPYDELNFDIADLEAESFHEAHAAAERWLEETTHLGWAWELYKHPWPKLEDKS